MPFALACASHSPVMLDGTLAEEAVCAAVRASFDRMRALVEAFEPDLIVQFSPDHFHGFSYALMPSFCVGAEARSYGDWSTRAEALPVDKASALALLDAVRAADIDAALSYDMVVDHGFVQLWEMLFGRADLYPLVPIFVNCAAPPLPTYRRARLLGEAVGRFASSSGKRILFAASGGLSHDPLVPRIETAPPEVRSRLIGAKMTAEQQAEREGRIATVAAAAAKGEGPVRPLNPGWDAEVLDLLERQDWATLDAFTAEQVDEVAGSGANELLAWVAATAAMASEGPFEVVQRDYAPAPGWIAGVAHFSARSV
ncbi:MAG: 3-carboxyethylcatechol 2,3-dioxygenase [Citromicrobium sp.]|nr:MAG: 3-carboxyethylcatechol 2,3-dioxygenase [Citromicrobium sp.]